MKPDLATLCLHINEAFGNVPYPGDEQIVRDNSGFHLECEKIKSLLKGKDWRDVSFDTLKRLRSALPFLSAQGFRYYLPAFMVMSIINFHESDIIPDEVIRTLTLPDAADVDRIQKLATLYPEMQPFPSEEWLQILKTMVNTYNNGEQERAFFERISGFNAAQSSIICEFLEYMKDVHGQDFPNEEPETAIKRYWYLF